MGDGADAGCEREHLPRDGDVGQCDLLRVVQLVDVHDETAGACCRRDIVNVAAEACVVVVAFWQERRLQFIGAVGIFP